MGYGRSSEPKRPPDAHSVAKLYCTGRVLCVVPCPCPGGVIESNSGGQKVFNRFQYSNIYKSLNDIMIHVHDVFTGTYCCPMSNLFVAISVSLSCLATGTESVGDAICHNAVIQGLDVEQHF